MTDSNKTPILRTVQQAASLIKQADPESAVSEFFIRKLANTKKIRSINTGVKVLIDYNSLLAYLDGQEYPLKNEQINLQKFTGEN